MTLKSEDGGGAKRPWKGSCLIGCLVVEGVIAKERESDSRRRRRRIGKVNQELAWRDGFIRAVERMRVIE